MPTFTQDTRVMRTESQVSTEIKGETVLLQLGSGKYFSLNPVGNLIWSQLSEAKTVSQLCETVVEEYDVELERCLPDVLALLGALEASQFIVATTPSNSAVE